MLDSSLSPSANAATIGSSPAILNVPVVPVLPINSVTGESNQAAIPALTSVLHVINGEHFAGAERVQMHLGRELPQQGFRADFATLLTGRFAQQFDLSESKLYDFAMSSRWDLAVAKRMAKQMRGAGYQLLHAHTPRSAMITSRLARLLELPWVYHVHSPTVRDSSHPWRNRLNHLVERLSLRSVSHLITVSHSLRQQMLREGWREDQVTVVPNGVPAINPPRRSIPVVGGRWILGMVALMRPRKGLEIAMEAVQRLRSANHDVVLRCIGPFESSEYEQSIHQLAAKLDIGNGLEFVGFTKDIPAALAELDAMILPSLYGEGLPMVVLEAMAAGLPVVATRVEGTPEAVRHGVEGLLAEPNNVDSLSESLYELINGKHPWQQLSQAAIRRHAEVFSAAAMASGTAAVYRRVIASLQQPA